MLDLEYLDSYWEDIRADLADGLLTPSEAHTNVAHNAADLFDHVVCEVSAIAQALIELCEPSSDKSLQTFGLDLGVDEELARHSAAHANYLGAFDAMAHVAGQYARQEMMGRTEEEAEAEEARVNEIAELAQSMAVYAGFAIPDDLEDFWRELGTEDGSEEDDTF